MKNHNQTNRRDFLKTSASAALAASAMPYITAPLARADDEQRPIGEGTKSTADTIILLWMAGGMASTETFDPKHYEPFEVGLPVEKIYSTFPAIDTVVDNIKICEGLEHMAKVMDRGTLIRSHTVADLGDILHSRHQYHWHTGYVPPQTVAAPHLGAWMAKLLGPVNDAIPAFIDIGQRLEDVGEKEELKAFHTAGFLGGEFGPFVLPHPEQAVSAVQPPEGMTPKRFENRYKFYQRLIEQGAFGEVKGSEQRDSIIRSMDNAHRLLSSPAGKAFDLSLEPKEHFEKYNTGRFGRGCLLARRLAENGARFIEVTTEYVPFLHWDTHENGHETAKRMKQEIDRPIAQLILDLEERGMLDRTLVVIASEFSRDMIMEGGPGSDAKDQSRAKTDVLKEMKHYGMHRHFTQHGSVLLFGGGFKKGHLYGETAPERPCIATKDAIGVTDLHATLYSAMGIRPDVSLNIEKRPFYVTEDGKGVVREALFG